MIASAHFAAGVLSGMLAAQLAHRASFRAALAVGFGLISHVILDRIPHGDYGELSTAAMVPVVGLEMILGAVLFTRLLRNRVRPGWPVAVAAGLVGACIPDLKFPARVLLPDGMAAEVARRGNAFHSWFHAPPTSMVVGTATEVLAVAVITALLLTFPRRRPVL
jgi:hypothetical protein